MGCMDNTARLKPTKWGESNMSKHKTKTKMPWFAFYTADYMTATVLLSLAERGIYVDLLRLVWEYGSLPDDMDKIRVKMLPTGERNHPRIHRWIRKVLEQCFERTDDGRWFNPGFGDHHQSVTETPKLVTESPKPVTESPKFVTESPTFVTNSHKSPESEGVLSNGINAPESQEQNRTKNKNTAKDKEQKEQLSSLSPTVALKANGKIHDTNHEVDGRDDDDNDPTP